MHARKILIIEDSHFVCTVLEDGLTKAGFTVAIVRDGKEGLTRARKESPALIILDLILPGIPGEEICRQLKKNERTEKIPLIMLTGKTGDADRVLGRVLGADAYIPKPFDLEHLLDTVDLLLSTKDVHPNGTMPPGP